MNNKITPSFHADWNKNTHGLLEIYVPQLMRGFEYESSLYDSDWVIRFSPNTTFGYNLEQKTLNICTGPKPDNSKHLAKKDWEEFKTEGGHDILEKLMDRVKCDEQGVFFNSSWHKVKTDN